jgi:hypothetical protein
MIRVVKPAPVWALSGLLAVMDDADFAELVALTDMRPADALSFALEKSAYSFCAFDEEDQPIALGGIRHLAPGRPLIWMIAATSKLERQKKAFLQLSRAEFAIIRRIYPQLRTFVDSRWTKSIRWLEWLGFRKEGEAEVSGRFGCLMGID